YCRYGRKGCRGGQPPDPGRSGAGIRPGAEHWALSESVPRLWPHPCGTVGGEAGRWTACSRQPAPGTQQRRRRTARTGAGAGRGTATPLCGERLSPAILLVGAGRRGRLALYTLCRRHGSALGVSVRGAWLAGTAAGHGAGTPVLPPRDAALSGAPRACQCRAPVLNVTPVSKDAGVIALAWSGAARGPDRGRFTGACRGCPPSAGCRCDFATRGTPA